MNHSVIHVEVGRKSQYVYLIAKGTESKFDGFDKLLIVPMFVILMLGDWEILVAGLILLHHVDTNICIQMKRRRLLSLFNLYDISVYLLAIV